MRAEVAVKHDCSKDSRFILRGDARPTIIDMINFLLVIA